ncbi:MAG: cytochrome c3 family protein [Armatimonadetes bacterium]|nr:cytochrome c3 family protein [Armatimonadota bacterium]
MPQVFRKSSNVIAKLPLVFGAGLLVVITLVGANITPYTHRVGVALDQPAPFSHKHHVQELGIDCRYCHTGVEKSSFAGIPATETCLTCHSQIWTNSPLLAPIRDSFTSDTPLRWNRVNNVPDFVYFDHSIHIAKGVSCYTCHGRVDEMNLTFKSLAFEMSWCVNCHRNPEEFVRPTDEIFNPEYEPKEEQARVGRALVKEYDIRTEQLADCWVCHR